jgi:hypothetical protein
LLLLLLASIYGSGSRLPVLLIVQMEIEKKRSTMGEKEENERERKRMSYASGRRV